MGLPVRCDKALVIHPAPSFLHGQVKINWKFWLLMALVWTAVWLVLTAQLYLTVLPRGLPISLGEVAETQFLRVAIWAMCMPLVLWFYQVLPLSGRREWLALTVHFWLSVGAMLLNYVLRLTIDEFTGNSVRQNMDFTSYLVLTFNGRNFVDILIYWLIIGARHVHELYARQRDAEVARAELNTQLLDAQMHALKQQLQPHFLFNALNAVAMLVREKQEDRAVETLAQLSALLRRLIDNTREQQVPLVRELDFTQRYLEIEKVRFGDRLQIRYDVGEECLAAAVPSLMLQPLVENAVKHGISRRTATGRIEISIRLAAGRLHITVFNDPADDPVAAAVPAVAHIGLSTTRDRLRKTYGEDFQLECHFDHGAGSRVKLSVPFRPAAGQLPV